MPLCRVLHTTPTTHMVLHTTPTSMPTCKASFTHHAYTQTGRHPTLCVRSVPVLHITHNTDHTHEEKFNKPLPPCIMRLNGGGLPAALKHWLSCESRATLYSTGTIDRVLTRQQVLRDCAKELGSIQGK